MAALMCIMWCSTAWWKKYAPQQAQCSLMLLHDGIGAAPWCSLSSICGLLCVNVHCWCVSWLLSLMKIIDNKLTMPQQQIALLICSPLLLPSPVLSPLACCLVWSLLKSLLLPLLLCIIVSSLVHPLNLISSLLSSSLLLFSSLLFSSLVHHRLFSSPCWHLYCIEIFSTLTGTLWCLFIYSASHSASHWHLLYWHSG